MENNEEDVVETTKEEISSAEQEDKEQYLEGDTSEVTIVGDTQEEKTFTNQEKIEKTISSDSNTSNDKNVKKPVLLIAGVAIILILIAYFIISSLLLSDKAIVQKEIKAIFNRATESINRTYKNTLNYDLDKDALGVKGSLVLKSNYKNDSIDLNKLENYQINYGGVLDKKNNEASLNIELKDKTKGLIEAKGYIEGKKVLVDLGNIFPKTITTTLDTEIKDLDMTKSLNKKDLEVLLKKTEKLTLDYVDDKDISSEKVSKKINGKEDNYKKISYKINMNDYTKELLTAYKDDEEIVKILANLTSLKEKEIKEELEGSIKSLEDEEKIEFVTNVYLSGKTVKALEAVYEENELIIEIDGNDYNYKLETDGEKIFNGTYNKKEKLFTFKMDIDGQKVDLSIKNKNEKEAEGSLKILSDDFKLDVDINSKNIVKRNTQNTELVVKVNYEMDSEKISATITNKNEFTKKAKVDKITAKNSVDIDEITEDDMTTMYMKLLENIKPIIEEIMPGLM